MMERRVEITCLSCHNKFSVLDGDEEVNWTCPVCALKSQLATAQGRIAELEAIKITSKQAISLITKTLKDHPNWRIEMKFFTGFHMSPCKHFMVRLADNWDKGVFQYDENLSTATIKAINSTLGLVEE